MVENQFKYLVVTLQTHPDLNPIENVFAYCHDHVVKRNPKNTSKLIEIVKQEWNKIPLTVIRNCIKHLHKVMLWVDAHNGDYYDG